MKKITIMLAMILMVTLTQAQPGTNDSSFNPGGVGANASIFTTAIQSDGKIIITGGFTSYNGMARNYITRLNADGSLDASFGPGTGAYAIYTTAIQSDGKIIIGGFFASYNGTARNDIARLNADGSLDTSFDPGTGANASIGTTAIQSDGKVIIGGSFTSYNGTARSCIARLNTDGTLDVTFNPAGSNGSVLTTAIQSDGKIIIGGDFTSYNGTARNYIARMNSDGSLDTSFDPGTGADVSIRTTAIQSDGKVIIGGSFTSYNGTARNYIARLNADGSLDTSFDPGTGANNSIFTTAIQSDGKIIISGFFTSYNGTARNYIARMNSDGSLDTSFDPGTGADVSIVTTAIQSDGKVIIGGDFTSYNGTLRGKVARIENTISVNIKETVENIETHVTVTGDRFKSDTDWTVYDLSGRIVMNGGPGTYSLKNTGLYIISTKYGSKKYFNK